MMHDFKQFFLLQCSKLKVAPKCWIAVVLVGLIVGGMAVDYMRCADYLQAPVQASEVTVMFFSYRVTFMFYIFGLALLLSDAPFFDENAIYSISRMSGSRWMKCVSKYILMMSLSYTVFISLVGLLFTLGYVTWSPEWSVPAQTIASSQVPIGLGQGIYFDKGMLQAFSPYGALVMQYALAILYGYFMGMLIAVCNLGFKKNVGFIVAVSLHAIMLVISLDNLPVFKYLSLYRYACLAMQGSVASFGQSFAVLFSLDLLITLCGFKVMKHADISTTTIAWLS